MKVSDDVEDMVSYCYFVNLSCTLCVCVYIKKNKIIHEEIIIKLMKKMINDDVSKKKKIEYFLFLLVFCITNIYIYKLNALIFPFDNINMINIIQILIFIYIYL